MSAIIKNNLSEKYSKGTILIHWLCFLLIVLLIPTGFIMGDMDRGIAKLNLLKVHLFVGILVFALTLLRIWYFFYQKRPSTLETGNFLHNNLVIWIENSFYIILILLCITGLVTVSMGNFGEAVQNTDISPLSENFNGPSHSAHKALAILFIILLMGHIAGVVNHYLKNKENIIKRILP
ncbi:cytochrome b/b6 domain-containing protein [Sphingobacterium spiritivorum]|uniref:cytochrome b/b6 domain-containing protein n=1 Tax=Sphingobacterium spiritivorum TaxID=258 RepID=UPI003DA38645